MSHEEFLSYLDAAAKEENEKGKPLYKPWGPADGLLSGRKGKPCSHFMTLLFHVIYGPLMCDESDCLPSPDKAYAIIRLDDVKPGQVHTDTGVVSGANKTAVAAALKHESRRPTALALLVPLSTSDGYGLWYCLSVALSSFQAAPSLL